jgi:hypothetical protein
MGTSPEDVHEAQVRTDMFIIRPISRVPLGMS